MKITIEVDYTLEQLKNGYRAFYGDNEKPKKADIAFWLGDLAQADVQNYVNVDLDE